MAKEQTTDLSEHTKQFIQRHVQTIWQLELLLAFKNSMKSMSLDEASRALYIEPGSLQSVVASYVKSGILKEVDGERFKYEPTSKTITEALNETELLYIRKKTSLIDFIYRI